MRIPALLTGLALGLSTTAQAAPIITGWSKLWTTPGAGRGHIAEIPAYDPVTDTVWVAGVKGVDVLDRASGASLGFVDVTAYGAINSVAIANGVAALALENTTDRMLPGTVLLYDTTIRGLRAGANTFAVGALPDMLTFTPDGRRILVANEGTPSVYGSRIGTSVPRVYGPAPFDPPGSVSVIDLTNDRVTTIALADTPESGNLIRKNTGMDFEPEYIAVSHDGKKAFVTLQEANALAILNLETLSFERIVGLGVKDFNSPGNEIDPWNNGTVSFVNVAAKGLYMPDGIQTYRHRGQTFLVMANEGDFREDDADRSTAGSLSAGAPLSNLRISNTESSPGNYYAAGARSFSIRDADGNLVYDSGSILDREAAARGIYDDARSRDKGVEPEDVALLDLGGRVYAFIGLERTTQAAIALFDITNPYSVQFIDMIVSPGDLAPEGVKAFRAVDGGYYLAFANETSNTTTLYRLNVVPEPVTWSLLMAGLAGLLVLRRR